MRFIAVAEGRVRRRGRIQKAFHERAENIAARELLAEALSADFANVLTAFQGDIPIGAMGEALTGGSVGIAEEAIPWWRLQARLATVLPPNFARGIEEGARIGLRFSPPALGIEPSSSSLPSPGGVAQKC